MSVISNPGGRLLLLAQGRQRFLAKRLRRAKREVLPLVHRGHNSTTPVKNPPKMGWSIIYKAELSAF